MDEREKDGVRLLVYNIARVYRGDDVLELCRFALAQIGEPAETTDEVVDRATTYSEKENE